MGYLRQEVDEAGAPLERMAQAQDRLAEAFTDAVGPPQLNPTTGHAEWTVTVTELFGEVPDPPQATPTPRAEREAWLANRVGPPPGTSFSDEPDED